MNPSRFLQDQESSAFRFYRLKVRELCPTIDFKEAPEEPPPQSPTEEPPAGETDNSGKEAEGPEGWVEDPAEGPASSGTMGTPPEAASPAPPRGTPFLGRKRVSSKSLKVGLIPASKRVCLIDEPKGESEEKDACLPPPPIPCPEQT